MAGRKHRLTIDGEPLTIVGVIPARGGSKGVPRKALSDLDGQPLIAHTIDAALSASVLDRVVVSTDDPEIARVAIDRGASVPRLRPAGLASDRASLDDALAWTLDVVARDLGAAADVLVTLMPTHPFRRTGLVDQVVETLLSERAGMVSTWSRLRGRPEDWLVADGAGHRRPGVATSASEALYRAAGSVAAEWRGAWAGSPRLRGGWLGVPVDGADTIDVDEPADLERARATAGVLASGAQAGWYPSDASFLGGALVVVAEPEVVRDDPWSPRPALSLLTDLRALLGGSVLAARRVAPRSVEVLDRDGACWRLDGVAPGLLPLAEAVELVVRNVRAFAHCGALVILDAGTIHRTWPSILPALDACRPGGVVMIREPAPDHPLLLVRARDGRGRLWVERAPGTSVRRQDLPPVDIAMGMVVIRPGPGLPLASRRRFDAAEAPLLEVPRAESPAVSSVRRTT